VSAVVTAAAIGLMSVLAFAQVTAATCPRAASVLGEARITEPVRAMLRAHDVSTGECKGTAARVQAWLIAEPGARGYVLRIQDPFGRKSERRISDAETAASLIESWLPPEADSAPLVAERAPVARAQAADENVIRAVKPPAGSDWRISGAAEIGISGGDSLWYGGSVTACGSVGTLCLGGRLRMVHDDNFFDLDHDSGSRSAVELLALAAWPLAAHGIKLMPLLGFGVGASTVRTPSSRTVKPTCRAVRTSGCAWRRPPAPVCR